MVSSAATVTLEEVPAKPWAAALTVTCPGFCPEICAPVAGVVKPAPINTLGVTVTTLVSVLVRLIVTPPAGAGAARLTANGVDWPCVTVTLAGRDMAPNWLTVTFAVPLI